MGKTKSKLQAHPNGAFFFFGLCNIFIFQIFFTLMLRSEPISAKGWIWIIIMTCEFNTFELRQYFPLILSSGFSLLRLLAQAPSANALIILEHV